MNKWLLTFAFTVSSIFLYAQRDVVQWKFESKKLDGQQYEVRLIAEVQQPWHIYSTTTPDGGPLPTKIVFNKNPLASPSGKIKEEGKLESHFEEVFDVDTRYFNNRVEFVQIVSVKGKAKTNLSGTVEYMACTDRECLPPKAVPFTIALK